MKIIFVSTTSYSGGQIRMAEAVNRYCAPAHEAVALSPTTWEPTKRWLGAATQNVGVAWNIRDKRVRDRWLDWADCLHFVYNSSLHDLGREDLLGKKICVWHLATKWRTKFLRYFPGDSAKHYRFVLSAEGWSRYDVGAFDWTIVPVLFPIDTALFKPISFSRRTRSACMTPRILVDTDEKGRTISAPRAAKAVDNALVGLRRKIVNFVSFGQCMKIKRQSWIGIDDCVNALIHLSGFEFLSLAVPCVNKRDAHVERELGNITGAPWPFIDGSLDDPTALRNLVEQSLNAPAAEWRVKCEAARRWMEQNYAAKDMVQHYLNLYLKA